MKELLKVFNKYGEQSVLVYEKELLEALGFDLKVFHPRNCVDTIMADLKEWAMLKYPSDPTLRQVLSVASKPWVSSCYRRMYELQVI